jgi:3-(3-hydroxy-phenyl)propionate hydroxylase
MQTAETTDVLVVGYGPTGATAALLLARDGLKVTLVDKAPDIIDWPRAIGIDHEAMRVLQFCGVAHDLFPKVRVYQGSFWQGMDQQTIREFKPLPAPYPLAWPPNMTFVQPEFEGLLRDAAANTPGLEINLSHELTHIVEQADGVVAQVRSADGRERQIKAKYVVAADGARSTVRKSLGIELEDLGFSEWWVVVDALVDPGYDYGNRNCYFCYPERPGCYVVGPGRLRRWEFRIRPEENPDEFRSDERILEVLGQRVDTSHLKLWRNAVFRFHTLNAQQWRSGRIFLAGDAAHQTPPHLGQGMVSGIRDAANIAWKIAMVERGASETLFDSYAPERRPHFESLVKTAKEHAEIVGTLDVQQARERDRRLAEEDSKRTQPLTRQSLIPPLKDGFFAGFEHSAHGELFIQLELQTPQGIAFLDDARKPRFQIYAVDGTVVDSLSETASSVWNRLHAEILVAAPSAVSAKPVNGAELLIEAVPKLAQWLDRNAACAVIVRPDRYVYAVAASADELDALVIRLGAELGIEATTEATV